MTGIALHSRALDPGQSWPSGCTRIAGVIGTEVRNSISPAIHNSALAEVGLDWVYVAFPVASGRAGDAVAGMRSLGIEGLSVTMPHKIEVVSFLDSLTDVAKAVAAVNTIFRNGDRLIGDNTDVEGFREAFRLAFGTSLSDKKLVVVGAGGAARAVAWAAITDGAAEISILARRGERAAVLVDELSAAADTRGYRDTDLLYVRPGSEREVVARCEVLVSATPSIPAGGVFDTDWLGEGTLLYDLVYQPDPTRLMEAASAREVRVAGGLGMLVAQAARQFELWTGTTAPRATMEVAARKALAGSRIGE